MKKGKKRWAKVNILASQKSDMQKYYKMPLFAILVLATISIGMVEATSGTVIDVSPFGNTQIDLALDENDRLIRGWTEISNFQANDGSFIMQIVDIETQKIVSESTIHVMTTSQNSLINFNSFVFYLVNQDDICQNESLDGSILPLEQCDPKLGLYEMRVTTNDGLAFGSTTFEILDSRI